MKRSWEIVQTLGLPTLTFQTRKLSLTVSRLLATGLTVEEWLCDGVKGADLEK